MKKNVVIITGSPRKGGNTSQLAGAFAAGAKASGHDAAIFDAAEDMMKPCTGCDACWSKGSACIYEDGFVRLAPLLEKAEVIAFCGPVYWFSFSSQMKLVIDKLYAFSGSAPKKLKASSYLLMCAGDPSPEIFSIVRREYEAIVPYLGLTPAGELLVPGVYQKGDINNTDALARAEQLGRHVA